MLLRTRVIVLVCIAFIAIGGIFVAGTLLRNDISEKRLSDALFTAQEGMWTSFVNERLHDLVREVVQEAPLASFREAIAKNDLDTLRSLMADLGDHLTEAGGDIKMEVVDKNGQPLGRLGLGSGAPPLVNRDLLGRTVLQGSLVSGIDRLPRSIFWAILGAPLKVDETVIGGLIIAADLGITLKALAEEGDGNAVMLSPDGLALTGTDIEGWQSLIARQHYDPRLHVQWLVDDDRVMRLIKTNVHRLDGDVVIGNLVVVSDVTESFGRWRDIGAATIIAAVSIATVIVVMLFFYLRAAFRPLTGAVNTLDLLAKDAGERAGRPSRRTDEIARIVEAVEVFRETIEARNAYVALQRELEIARRLQLSVLPTEPPPHREISLCGHMITAHEVGGDFYDYFEVDDGRLALVVADVAGKGVPGAFFMAMTRTLLRASVTADGAPGDWLAHVNEVLVENNPRNMFVTLFFGVLDLATGAFTYVNAGHPPPLLARPGRGASPIGLTGGLVLAAIGDQAYGEARIDLEPGDLLFLYTDGITEAMTAENEEYGESRLAATVTSMAGEPVDRVADGVIEAVHSFVAGAEQSDDITCLAVRFVGEAGPGDRAAET